MCIWKVRKKDRRCEFCTYECQERKKPDRDTSVYVTAMEQVVGPGLLGRSRCWDLVWGRNMVAYKMRMDGFGSQEISRTIKRDHSTVAYCVARMEEMLSSPHFYAEELKNWHKFIKIVDHEQNLDKNSEDVVLPHREPCCKEG